MNLVVLSLLLLLVSCSSPEDRGVAKGVIDTCKHATGDPEIDAAISDVCDSYKSNAVEEIRSLKGGAVENIERLRSPEDR